MENILVCQDLVRNYHKEGVSPRCLLKLDIRKAYDSLEWPFLEDMMRKLNFPEMFVKWIMTCISSTSFSFMINGKSYGFIKGKRGLRQGDPISPLLFVIAMEYFSRIMKGVAENPNFGFHLKCKKLKLNNLCFADDLMIVRKADINSAKLVKQAIEEFGATSGLMTNPSKCQMFVAGVSSEIQKGMQQILQFSTGTLPVRYLGIPLITTRLTDDDCKPILDRIKRKINNWASKSLSYARRLQLINSVLFHIQVYWSSVLVLPASVFKKIESMCFNFLWQSQQDKRSMALVSLKQICVPKSEGGLGVKQLRV